MQQWLSPLWRTSVGAPEVVTLADATLVLPRSPATCNFLTDRERQIARMRLLKDGSAAVNTKFDLKAFFKPLKDPKTIAFATIALCYGTASSVASNFLPTIVAKFGYSVVKTNLYTVAPNMFATVLLREFQLGDPWLISSCHYVLLRSLSRTIRPPHECPRSGVCRMCGTYCGSGRQHCCWLLCGLPHRRWCIHSISTSDQVLGSVLTPTR